MARAAGKGPWQDPVAGWKMLVSCIQEAERIDGKEASASRALQSHTFGDLLPPTEPCLP